MCALLIIRNLLPHVAFDGWSVIHTHLPQCTCYSYYSFLSSTFSLPRSLRRSPSFACSRLHVQELHFLSLTLSVTSNEHKSPLSEASLACLWVCACTWWNLPWPPPSCIISLFRLLLFLFFILLLRLLLLSVSRGPFFYPFSSASSIRPSPQARDERVLCSRAAWHGTHSTLWTAPLTRRRRRRQFKLTRRLDTFFYAPSMYKARSFTPRHEKVSAPSASDCEW